MGRHKRQSGGQPGNQNARKHGFYAANLSREELSEYWQLIKIQGMDPQLAVLQAKLACALRRAPANRRVIMEGANILTNMFDRIDNTDKKALSAVGEMARTILKAAVKSDVGLTKRVALKFLKAAENAQNG